MVLYNKTQELLEFELKDYLSKRRSADSDADIQYVDELIWSKYGEKWAILFTDLTGFSSSVFQRGILETLEIIFLFRNIAEKIIDANAGVIMKTEGDSLIVIFKTVQSAVKACIEINDALSDYNQSQDERQIFNACGIGYGQIIKLAEFELFGLEVNLASKLGEDIGKGGEVLLTEAAKMELEKYRCFDSEPFIMNEELDITAYRLSTETYITQNDPILLLGDPLLYEKSLPIDTSESQEVQIWIQKLHHVLMDFREEHGFGRGIAAPQLGIQKRLIYVLINGEPTALLNPSLTFPDDETFTLWDDCMCFPNLKVKVSRFKRCQLTYQDSHFERHTLFLEGDLSELIQHEYDHLEGILATMRAVDTFSFKMGM